MSSIIGGANPAQCPAPLCLPETAKPRPALRLSEFAAGKADALAGQRSTGYGVVEAMISARFVIPLVIAASLPFVCLAPAGIAAELEPIDLRIEIFGFAGFHVLTNRTRVATSPDRYTITMDLDTRGLASLFVDLTSHSEVAGRLIGGAAHPETYRGDVRRNSLDHHYGIDYRGDGTVTIASQRPPTEPLNLVPEDQMRGTVDQLTAYFLLERQLSRHGSCALVVSVFDGRHRYNLRFTDVQQALPAPGDHYFGPTVVCAVARQDIGVADPDRIAEGYRAGKIWYAPLLPGDQMVPVGLEFDTEFGIVQGRLAELHGRGVNLRLME